MIRIRSYTAHDLTTVLNVWEPASRQAHPFLQEAFFQQERMDIAHLYLPNSETWVLESEGLVQGFVSLIGHEVGGLFVHPNAQGQGYGRRLLDHARALKGTLTVKVFAENSKAQAFYTRYGFCINASAIDTSTGCCLLHCVLSEQPSGAEALLGKESGDAKPIY